MPLTDTAIRNSKPQNKQYKMTDEKGMYLLVNKAGKYFRLDYRFADQCLYRSYYRCDCGESACTGGDVGEDQPRGCCVR